MADEMIAFCGLTCTGCDAYLATKANDAQKAQQTADLWSKQYGATVTVDDVWCDGCLVEGRKCAHCGECEIRACAQEKTVENCAHCSDYPCQTLSGFFKMVPMAKEKLESIRQAP